MDPVHEDLGSSDTDLEVGQTQLIPSHTAGIATHIQKMMRSLQESSEAGCAVNRGAFDDAFASYEERHPDKKGAVLRAQWMADYALPFPGATLMDAAYMMLEDPDQQDNEQVMQLRKDEVKRVVIANPKTPTDALYFIRQICNKWVQIGSATHFVESWEEVPLVHGGLLDFLKEERKKKKHIEKSDKENVAPKKRDQSGIQKVQNEWILKNYPHTFKGGYEDFTRAKITRSHFEEIGIYSKCVTYANEHCRYECKELDTVKVFLVLSEILKSLGDHKNHADVLMELFRFCIPTDDGVEWIFQTTADVRARSPALIQSMTESKVFRLAVKTTDTALDATNSAEQQKENKPNKTTHDKKKEKKSHPGDIGSDKNPVFIDDAFNAVMYPVRAVVQEQRKPIILQKALATALRFGMKLQKEKIEFGLEGEAPKEYKQWSSLRPQLKKFVRLAHNLPPTDEEDPDIRKEAPGDEVPQGPQEEHVEKDCESAVDSSTKLLNVIGNPTNRAKVLGKFKAFLEDNPPTDNLDELASMHCVLMKMSSSITLALRKVSNNLYQYLGCCTCPTDISLAAVNKVMDTIKEKVPTSFFEVVHGIVDLADATSPDADAQDLSTTLADTGFGPFAEDVFGDLASLKAVQASRFRYALKLFQLLDKHASGAEYEHFKAGVAFAERLSDQLTGFEAVYGDDPHKFWTNTFEYADVLKAEVVTARSDAEWRTHEHTIKSKVTAMKKADITAAIKKYFKEDGVDSTDTSTIDSMLKEQVTELLIKKKIEESRSGHALLLEKFNERLQEVYAGSLSGGSAVDVSGALAELTEASATIDEKLHTPPFLGIESSRAATTSWKCYAAGLTLTQELAKKYIGLVKDGCALDIADRGHEHILTAQDAFSKKGKPKFVLDGSCDDFIHKSESIKLFFIGEVVISTSTTADHPGLCINLGTVNIDCQTFNMVLKADPRFTDPRSSLCNSAWCIRGVPTDEAFMKLSDHEKFDVDTCAGPITIHMPSLVVDMGKANELHQAAKRFAEKRDAYVAYEREYKGARKDKEKAPTGTTAVEVTRPV
ncbi:unnamed protein product, partial [Prorocentrum cordatum]